MAHGFLIVVASLVAEHRLWGTWATAVFDHIDSSNHPVSSESYFLETCPHQLLNSCVHILPLTHSSTLKLDCGLYHLEATICLLPLSHVWLWITPSMECSVPLEVCYLTSCCLLVSFEDTTFFVLLLKVHVSWVLKVHVSWDLVLIPFLSHFMPCSWEITFIPGTLYIYYLSIYLTICQWLPILISPELTP